MRDYGYFEFEFLVPPTKACREMSYFNEDPRCRMQSQFRLEQQQYMQQLPQVSFKAVDVKELEE